MKIKFYTYITFLLLLLANTAQADILLDEQFTGAVMPVGWTTTVLQGAQAWTIQGSPFFGSPSAGNYAIFDDNALGAAVTPNEADLITPSLNCTGRTAVYLAYSHYWFGVEFTHGYVEISNNGGGAWTTLVDYEKFTKGSLAASQDTILNITTWAANQADVMIRFRYTDGSQAGRYWYIDDVKVYSDPDVGVTALIDPDYLNCTPTAYTATETVTVEITNFGVNPVSNIPVTCVLSNGTTATLTGTFVGPLAAGASANYTFATTIDMSADDYYDFTAFTSLGTDEYIHNDTLFDSRQQLVITYPYFQDFNSSTAGWFSTGSAPPNNGGRNFVLGDLPYLNGAQGNGDSWYCETTVSNNGTYIWVESPIFDFSSLANPQLSFDIKHSLHNSDYFHVEYSINGGGTWVQLGSSATPNWYNTASWWRNSYTAPVDSWLEVQQNLCILAGQPCVQFRIYGRPYYSSPTYTDYHKFAFDNFLVSDGPDIATTVYIDPVDVGCLFNTDQQVTVTVYNLSCAPLSNIPIECMVTGAITDTLNGVIPGPIAVGATFNYTFPSTINMIAVGTYDFNTYTQLAGDVNLNNDTLATSINVTNLKVTTYPYFEDFNSGPAYWNATGAAPPLNGGRNFLLGNLPYLNGPQGNGDSWYCETTSSNNGTYIWVESPVFDFTNLTNPVMTFDIKHSLHNSDYFHVEYSINGGGTWVQLGGPIEPTWYNATNWWRNSYTAPVDVWTEMRQELCVLSGEPCVKFRIYGRPYYSAPTYTDYHKFAFDNFMIDAGSPDDIQPIEIILSDAGECIPFNATETIAVLIRNNTCRPLYDVPVDLQLNGGPIISEVMPGPIPRFGNYIYTFTSTLDLSPAATHNISVTTNLPTDTFPANDTRIENRISPSTAVSVFPYSEDFEATNGGWVSRTTVNHRYMRWDTLPYLNGPEGNGKSWYCETTLSNNGTYVWVESPIFDFSGMTSPQLTFDIKHSLHNSDYFHVEYSLNGGTSWTQLGTSTQPYWYNTASWWRNSYANPVNRWTQVQHSLCALAGESCVKFRIYGRPYYSEPTYANYHKFAFDNVEIKDGPDVGVIAFVDPVDLGCLFSTEQQVTVRVYNWTCSPISNVPVQCDVTGQITDTLNGVVPGPIPTDGYVDYTFADSINMIAVGTYFFNSYTQLPGDINLSNDTFATTVNIVGLKVNTFPYFEDFESGNGYWFANGSAPPLNGGRNFVLDTLPYLNGHQGNGSSWYCETTSSNNGTYIWVESPVFDFTNLTNPTLSFDIKHSLHNSDYFHVEYSINGGASWVQLGGPIDPNWYNATSWWRNSYAAPVDVWTHMEQELCVLSGQPCVKFRIYGRPYYSAPTYADYHKFAFDNFSIDAGAPDDIEPIEIILSDAGDGASFTATETIQVLIKNNTCRTLYNVPVDLQLNGGPIISEVMPGPINRFGNYIYTFTNTLDLSPAGTHDISVTTNLATDSFPSNDTRVEDRYNLIPISVYPYVEDFETTNGGWVSRTTVNHRYFHWDTLPYLNGPEGNGKSWFCETTSSNNSTYIWVESPIMDFTTLNNPQISFDLKHSLHNSDYFHVEYSINGGTTWTQVGTGSDPNWYNTASWWRNSYTVPQNTWANHQHSLCALSGQSSVKIRIYGRPYYSAPTYANYHKFAFDNIIIEEGSDLSVITYIDPVDDGCLFTATQEVTIEVFNLGCGPETNIPVSCDITGVLTTTLTGTVPGPIPAGGSVNYTFATTIDMTPIGIYNFQSYTQDPFDINNLNDSLATTIDVQQVTYSTFDYFQDFNSGADYWLAKGSAPPLNGGRNFVLGALPYLNGPEGLGDSWYCETTASNNGTYIWVESPVFDFSAVTNPKLLMDIKHSLHNSDYFHVEYSINGGSTWIQLGSSADPYWYNTASWWRNSYTVPVDSWTNVEHTLCMLAGQSCVKFRVYGRPYYSAPTYTDYHKFSFDNFHITDTPLDAECDVVTGCFGSAYQLEVTVINNSRHCLVSPDITSIDLTYTIDGGAPVTQNFAGLNIPFGGADVVIIPGVSVPGPGSTIKVWCSNPNGLDDHVFENDTSYSYSVNWPDCNDHCTNATVLGQGTTTASQNSNATSNPGTDPNFAGCGLPTLENTVWYQFTTDSLGGDVTIFFENTICVPSTNGIQVSIDQLTGAPCDSANYVNVFCESPGTTDTITWDAFTLPPNTTYYITIDGFAGNNCDFDIRITGAVGILLPTTLTEFKGTSFGHYNLLNWSTEKEIDNDYFELERSADGINFAKIATIDAIGVSSMLQHYQYSDNQPINGWNYYRLKQVDNNSAYQYSSTIALYNGNDEVGIKLQPNPATDKVSFDYIGADINAEFKVEIVDVSGRKLFVKEYTPTNSRVQETISTKDFSSGVYFVQFSNGIISTSRKLIIVD